ncbi:MAG: biotin--[acetyl-CoA-carboxylase] ligase [Deltaproteobacteria bacterium]|nr:biotin--[acetyl-CoA-carboxylase] ligase [Deltaproteobacteria bacterium]
MGRVKLVTEGGPHAVVRGFDVADFLETERIGRTVEIWERLPSTNDRAVQLAKQGALAGLAVVAIEQTQGRGQRGRRWASPPGAGLYVSFVVRPNLSPRLAPTLTLIAGVAVRAALSAFCPVRLGIKWPNDILAAEGPEQGKKLAGILLEASADPFKIDHAVIGIGVNLSGVGRPAELEAIATDLSRLGVPAPPLPVLFGAIANELERRLYAAEMEGLGPLARTWTTHALGLGQEVVVRTGEEVLRGTHLGIAEDGALLLGTPNGRRPVYRGDLELPGVPRSPLSS